MQSKGNSGLEHRLSAILLTDIVDYSRLMDADEEGSHAAIQSLRSEVILPLLAEHHGRLVKFMGDGIMVEFPTVHEALNFAIQVQRKYYIREKDKPKDKRIIARIGINLGDIIVAEDGDIFGDGVNVAARLKGITSPGGICISGPVYESVQKGADLPFIDLGRQKFKNIKSEVRAYDVDLGEGSWPHEAHKKPLIDKFKKSTLISIMIMAGLLVTIIVQFISGPKTLQRQVPELSVAVLPFVNMSSDP